MKREGHAVGGFGSDGGSDLRFFSAAAAFAVTVGCALGKPCCYGTGIDDRLTGTNGEDEILTPGGRDFVDARGGSGVVHGGSRADGD